MFLFLFFFFFFTFSFFIFFYQKDGVTPLYIATQNGHEQTVRILLEKGNPNVDLATEVILLIVSFSFFFLRSHFLIFLLFFNAKDGVTLLSAAAFQGHERIVEILLENGKANVNLTEKVLFLIIISFSLF